MPNGSSLEIHLFAVAERIAALRAARARWMKVMVVTGLQDFSADVAFAVSAFHAVELLVVLLAIRLAVFAHVFAAQNGTARQTPKKRWQMFEKSALKCQMQISPKAPDVPLTVQSDERLAFFQLHPASGTVIRIVIFGACRLLKGLVMLLLGRRARRTSVLLCHHFLLHGATTDTLLAQNFLSGVGDLSKNRFC